MPTRLTQTRKHRGHVSGMYIIREWSCYELQMVEYSFTVMESIEVMYWIKEKVKYLKFQ